MHKSPHLSAATPFFVELETVQGLGECLGHQHMPGFLRFQSSELKWVFYEQLRCRGQE